MDNETANIDGALKAVQKTLGQTYKFIQHLGGGEFSNVYLVKHIKTDREYALKVLDYHFLLQKLKKENRLDPHLKINEIKKRFITEAKLYKKIHHSNIVKIHDTGVVQDETRGIEIPFMVMTYIRGSSLSDLLRNEAPFTLNRTLEISRDVLNALEVIHRNNIIHRDIKPANIMIENETGKAIIIDFGIAKDIVGGSRLTATGSSIGTPTYMAPEQFVDSSKVDQTIDIYSFGIVLYEMLTGKAPFGGMNFIEIMNAHREKPIPDPRQKNPQLPQQVTEIINKAMAKESGKRYQHTKDLLKDLEWMLTGTPLPAKEKEKTGRPYQKFYIFLMAFIIAAVVLLFLLNPFGTDTGKTDPGKDINGTRTTPKVGEEGGVIHGIPSETTQQAQLQEMKKEFENLKEDLNGEADKKEKIEQYQAFLNKYREHPAAGHNEAKTMADDIKKTIEGLQVEISKDEQYQTYIDRVKNYAENHQYDKSLEMANRAKTIKDTPEIKELLQEIETEKSQYEKINGKADYDAIKEKISLVEFLNFKKKYPGSTYLPDLHERLKKKDANLPPQKYWDSLRQNGKGYYEIIFDQTHNSHHMIYIPGRKIWIDKYEVSNRQWRELPDTKKKAAAPQQADKVIREDDDYPALLSYNDAKKYCQQYGLRLPRLDEWEYAAGKGVYTYPWGNESPGANGIWPANCDSLGDEGNEEKDGYRGTAPIKSFETFSSPFGAVNMAGNVREWVQGQILKGGSFISAPDDEDLMIKDSKPGRKDETHGFRCVKDEK